jgi:hypothetical protein
VSRYAVSDRPSAELARYRRHLEATVDWLARSIERGRGGSAAYWAPGLGWSRPYPETTGYLIPTLLEVAPRLPERGLVEDAVRLGTWLLGIQLECGAWHGGLHPPRGPARPSVFNTGQVLKGLAALHRKTGDARWLAAARRGAVWLAEGIDASGAWGGGDYRSSRTPTYYTEVACPMLEVARLADDPAITAAAERVLRSLRARRRSDGWFDGWAFGDAEPAFTHTIAYALRGFLDCARILDRFEEYGAPTLAALELLRRRAERSRGRLPGAFAPGFRPVGRFTCLTGNAQIALCLLAWEEQERDLRLVNAAAKLVDAVCARQSLTSVLPGKRGGVSGSAPLWGPYMRFRYPNWAAKYLCDAIVALSDRLYLERGRFACA